MNHQPDLVHAALASLTAVLYVVATGMQLLRLDQRATPRGAALWLALAAVACHLLIAVIDIETGSLSLGFYKVASLIFLTMGVIALATLMLRPIHMLVSVIFPLSALSVLINAFAPATGQPMSGLHDGAVLHVLLAVIAFGVLTLATLQGALVSLQAGRLRNHQTRGVVRMLPPLTTMEGMFYELLTAGTALLTLAIIAGGLFIDDMFGQKLAHKTVLTTIAWAIFTGTLAVHWRRGLRIGTGLTLVFIGFACMAVGFFGSKLVLELLL